MGGARISRSVRPAEVAGAVPRISPSRPLSVRFPFPSPSAGVSATALVLLAAACAVPDRPAGLAPPLAEGALALLAPDTVRSFRVADGVFYRYAWSPQGPWAVHLVSADLARCDLGFVVVPALADDGLTRSRLRVSEMSPPPGLAAVAAVNGDFFTPQGRPLGTEITASTWRWAARPALAWREGRGAWIGTPVRRGGRIEFGAGDRSEFDNGGMGADSAPAHRGGWQAVGGYPELLDAGRIAAGVATARPDFAALRHPRTGVGADTDLDRLWMVVVDGRQEPRSAGMTLLELARLMASLGVDEAINLDGGGSSAMLLRGRLANRPSDASGERRVANSLWLVRDAAPCRHRRSGP